MPKIALTEEQRRALAAERFRGVLADGLNAYKARKSLTNAEMSDKLGIGRMAVSAVLAGDNVRLSIDQAYLLMSAAGLRVTRPEMEVTK